MSKRKELTRSYRKGRLLDIRKGWRVKRNKEFKQQLHNKKLRQLLIDQMAKDEFEKAEYQRTGIQH